MNIRLQHWVLLFSLASQPSLALAADIPVRIDARCSDHVIQYGINKQALDTLRATSKHKAVTEGAAEIIIRISASPVKRRDGDTPEGVAMAILVQRKSKSGAWDITRFASSFVPLDQLNTSVAGVVDDALK